MRLTEHKKRKHFNAPEHLSSKEANSILLKILHRVIAEYETQTKFDLPRKFFEECRKFVSLFAFLSAVMLYICFGTIGGVHYLLEAVIITLTTFFNIALNCWKRYIKHHELTRLIKTRLPTSVEDEKLVSGHLDDAFPSGEFVWVIRDDRLVKLPVNILVPGDIIELKIMDVAPCACDLVVDGTQARSAFQPQSFRREGAQVFYLGREQFVTSLWAEKAFGTSDFDGQRLRFRATEAPGARQLQKILQNIGPSNEVENVDMIPMALQQLFSERDPHEDQQERRPLRNSSVTDEVLIKKPKTRFRAQKKTFYHYRKRIFLIGLTLSVIFMIAMLAKEANGWRGWVQLLCGQTSVLVISVLYLPAKFWLFLMDAFGNASIFALYESLAKTKDAKQPTSAPLHSDDPRNTTSSSTPSVHGSTPGYTPQAAPHNLQEPMLSPKSNFSKQAVWDNMKKILLGKFGYVTYTMNPVDVLGNVTTLINTDKHGILSQSRLSAEHVMVWEEGIVVLDVINDETSKFGITFESEWLRHMGAVKALGLACQINTQCDASDFHESSRALWERDQSARSERIDHIGRYPSDCLCSLGSEIGFDEAATKQSYTQGKQFSSFEDVTARCTNALAMASVAVDYAEDGQKHTGSHLFSRGSTPKILENCKYMWRGDHISSLTLQQKRKINDIYHHWDHEDLHCVGFSYSPIPRKHISYFKSDGPARYRARSRSSSRSTLHSGVISNVGGYRPKVSPMRNIRKQLSSSRLGSDSESSFTQSRDEVDSVKGEIKEDHSMDHFQRGQIFVGIAATRNQPKQEAPELIEKLSAAGIRFVYFSKQNAQKSKAFAEVLGMDVTWNSSISLANNNWSFGLKRSSTTNISKLPTSITTVRDHIENVDNVPLLVSLFTDCSSESIREMVRVFQDYGDTVFCCGSSLKETNTPVFMQADAVISLQPTPARTCRKNMGEEKNPFEECMEYYISSTLTSLPCLISFGYKTDLTQICDIIYEGKRLMTNLKQSLLFGFSCSLALFFMLVLQTVFGSAPLLYGYQVIWFIWIIIPLISVPLLATERDAKIEELISKKKEDLAVDHTLLVTNFMIRIIPPFLLYFGIFQWFLYALEPDTPWFTVIWHRSPEFLVGSDVVLAAQNYALMCLVYFIVFMSMGFVHPVKGLMDFKPYRNRAWAYGACVIFVLQSFFCLISLSTAAEWPNLPRDPLLFALICPLEIIVADMFAKRRELQRHLKNQKRLRLMFGTKLGMHSPK